MVAHEAPKAETVRLLRQTEARGRQCSKQLSCIEKSCTMSDLAMHGVVRMAYEVLTTLMAFGDVPLV